MRSTFGVAISEARDFGDGSAATGDNSDKVASPSSRGYTDFSDILLFSIYSFVECPINGNAPCGDSGGIGTGVSPDSSNGVGKPDEYVSVALSSIDDRRGLRARLFVTLSMGRLWVTFSMVGISSNMPESEFGKGCSSAVPLLQFKSIARGLKPFVSDCIDNEIEFFSMTVVV